MFVLWFGVFFLLFSLNADIGLNASVSTTCFSWRRELNGLEPLLLLVPPNQKDFIYLVSRLQYYEEWLRTHVFPQIKMAHTTLLLSFKLALGPTLRKFVIS